MTKQAPLTEDLFFEFVRTKFPYKEWPTSFDVKDETDAKLAASWLLNILQELNAFLIEKEKTKENLNKTRVPKYTDRKKQVNLQRELS